ncbi:MAG: hypothetical protein WKG06_47420 [Segetibacter sp.]
MLRSYKKELSLKAKGAEASWILENNEMMNKALQNINGKVYKTYRIRKRNLQNANTPISQNNYNLSHYEAKGFNNRSQVVL